MTVLLISDVHANLEALEAVLADAGSWDALWFLGDAVGYGPDPVACVERLEALEPAVWLAGNHDLAALGRLDLADFNPDAKAAAIWTGEALTATARARLEAVEPLLQLDEPEILLVHASPRHPVWEYIMDAGTAAENFEVFSAPLGLFGHTHVPVIYEQALDGTLRLAVRLDAPHQPGPNRWLANPGSVGQPRDGDPRASYARLDPATLTMTFHRVAYDFATTQAKILDAGLPQRLAARLAYGW